MLSIAFTLPEYSSEPMERLLSTAVSLHKGASFACITTMEYSR